MRGKRRYLSGRGQTICRQTLFGSCPVFLQLVSTSIRRTKNNHPSEGALRRKPELQTPWSTYLARIAR